MQSALKGRGRKIYWRTMNDRQMQEGPSKWLCLSKVSPGVTLVWTDYTPGKRRGAAGPLREGLEMPISE